MAAQFPIPSSDRFLAINCVTVGVGPGGTTTMLARVAIVDYRGTIILNTFVSPNPNVPIMDYRTSTTGLQPDDLHPSRGAAPFETVQQHVANLISGKIIVGHSLWSDLSVLGIPHLAVNTRDVALYQPFRNALHMPNQIIGLQTLMWHLMCRRVQESYMDPVENARASMDLYRSHAAEWEAAVSKGHWPCVLPPSNFSRCYE